MGWVSSQWVWWCVSGVSSYTGPGWFTMHMIATVKSDTCKRYTSFLWRCTLVSVLQYWHMSAFELWYTHIPCIPKVCITVLACLIAGFFMYLASYTFCEISDLYGCMLNGILCTVMVSLSVWLPRCKYNAYPQCESKDGWCWCWSF